MTEHSERSFESRFGHVDTAMLKTPFDKFGGRSFVSVVRELEADRDYRQAQAAVEEPTEINENESMKHDYTPGSPYFYRKPLDLVKLHKPNRTFSIKDNQASVALAFIAGIKRGITNGAEFDALSGGEWAISSAISNDTYVYLEVDRENNTAKLRTATTTMPNGTDPIEHFPLYYIPSSATSIEPNIIDMRISYHWIAGA